MQNSQSFHGGELVRVRRSRWRIGDRRAYDSCQLLTLVGCGPDSAGVERRVLVPFDAVEPIVRGPGGRFVRPELWRRACRAFVASNTPTGDLRSARGARIDLLPHQLEPALAVVRGLGTRVLLADDVGLGKTIQAGLIVAELGARGAADRVLVVAPAGLREQWVQELARRFDIDAALADFASLGRLTATLPVGVNPWSAIPVSVVSIDYIKRPEVLPSLLSCTWDILIVDEAHGAVGTSDRHAAVARLASRAACVVLATATPHSGDDGAFRSLCSIGQVPGDRLLVFRRTRQDVHLEAARHVHLLRIRPGAEEARMHHVLARFTRAVRREQGDRASLALSVLQKRACSSAQALSISVGRRLAALAGTDRNSAAQLLLPMDDSSGEYSAEDDTPAWGPELALHNAALERRLLGTLADAASAAAERETKVAALLRLLRRIGEPAIVFTEYRDTLLHLARSLNTPAILHGGMTREERAASLAAFAAGGRPVLLATDAAGSGLNLHHACRVVINLELPWNPMRLEQRIGRVDRIGQRRAVHAFHLVARDTAEEEVLDRLRARLTRARTGFGAPEPLGADAGDSPAGAFSGSALDGMLRPDPVLAQDAAGQVERITASRRLMRPRDDDAAAGVEGAGPAILVSRRSTIRQRLAGRVVLLYRISSEDGDGHPVASTLVPLLVDAGHGPRDLKNLLRSLDPALGPCLHGAAAAWREAMALEHEAFIAIRIERERAIALAAASAGPGLFQEGLFDRRHERARVVAAAAALAEVASRGERLAALERAASLTMLPPQLVLVLAPR